MSLYNKESVKVLFTTMRLDTSEKNIEKLLVAGQKAITRTTESEAIRYLSFYWECAGVQQPEATRHAMIMLYALLEEQIESKKNA